MMQKSPFQKEEEIHEKLLDFFKKANRGFSTTDLEKITKISRKTLEKHLQRLVFGHEIKMEQYGPTRFYSPTHQLETIASEKLRFNNTIIWIDIIADGKNKYLSVKKKKYKDGKWVTENAFSLPIHQVKDFAKLLKRISNKI